MTSILGWWAEKEKETGVIALATKPSKFSATGQATPAGSIAASTKKIQASIGATHGQAGTMGASTKKIKCSMVQQNAGTLSASTKKASTNLTGTQTLSGLLSASAKKAIAALTGGQTQSGSMASKTKPLISTESGTVILPAITVNSISAGNTASTGGTSVTATFTITIVSGANRKLYVPVLSGNANWINQTLTCTSSLGTDGVNAVSLTQLREVRYGDLGGGNRAAKHTLFVLTNPAIGTHTITIGSSAGSTGLTVTGAAICLNGVSTEDAPVTQASTSTSQTLNVSISSAVGEEVLCFVGCSHTAPVFTGSPPTPFASLAPGGSGDGDSLNCFNKDGAGGTVTFTTSTSAKFGAILINVKKV